MSERMIELQRAKLGLLPAGQSSAVPNASVSPKASPNAPSAKRQTPEEAAVASMYAEDSQMERFINRLQKRDDSNPAFFSADATGETHGPTVPTALSRRMLQRQGVGYLDNTVAAVVSASADRFLATVLQQAVACRDQRLKGAAMAREAAKHRKRHIQHYDEDKDDRKRRKEMIEEARVTIATTTINKAEALKKGGSAKAAAETEAADGKTTKKKGKKKDDEFTNGTKLDPAIKRLADEEEEEYDSIDEEEEYYQERTGDATGGGSLAGDDDADEEEDDEDDTLILRDIVRPLEAWNFHLTGKEDLESEGEQSDEEEDESDEEDGAAPDTPVGQAQEKGKDEAGPILANGTDGNKPDNNNKNNKDDDKETDGKKASA
jgi:Transcription initiation factor TFIID 23-30kDa subunit